MEEQLVELQNEGDSPQVDHRQQEQVEEHSQTSVERDETLILNQVH